MTYIAEYRDCFYGTFTYRAITAETGSHARQKTVYSQPDKLHEFTGLLRPLDVGTTAHLVVADNLRRYPTYDTSQFS